MNQKPLSIVSRASLRTEATYRVIKMMVDLFSSNPSRPFVEKESTTELWDVHSDWQVSSRFDFYAQICVISKPLSGVRAPVVDEEGLKILRNMPLLLVSLELDFRSAYELSAVIESPTKVLIAAPMFPWLKSWPRTPLPPHTRLEWIAPIERGEGFLKGVPATCPIIVTHAGYDLAQGDFRGIELLRNIPHVVFLQTDIATLWRRLSVLEGGLAGETDLEYALAPAYKVGPHYGYLIVKAARRASPILVVPILLSFLNRVLSVIEAAPSPKGVRLVRAKALDSDEWNYARMAVPFVVVLFEEAY